MCRVIVRQIAKHKNFKEADAGKVPEDQMTWSIAYLTSR